MWRLRLLARKWEAGISTQTMWFHNPLSAQKLRFMTLMAPQVLADPMEHRYFCFTEHHLRFTEGHGAEVSPHVGFQNLFQEELFGIKGTQQRNSNHLMGLARKERQMGKPVVSLEQLGTRAVRTSELRPREGNWPAQGHTVSSRTHLPGLTCFSLQPLMPSVYAVSHHITCTQRLKPLHTSE